MAPKNLITRRSFIGGAAATTAFLAAGWPASKIVRAQQLTKVKFTLPWIPTGNYSFFFVAKKMGFWEKRGLDVEIARGFGSGEAAKTVGLGQYDIGYADYGAAILTAGKGLDVVGVAMGVHKNGWGFTSLKKSNIKKAKDLEGKRYGTASASGEYLMFPAFAKAAGIDADKVKIIFMAPAALDPALLEGNIDLRGIAYPAISPLLARKIPVDFILYADYGLEMYSHAVIATSKMIKEKPDLVAKFVDGAMEGLKFTYLNEEETVNIHIEMVKEYTGATVNRDDLRLANGMNAYLGMVDYVKEKGLGWMKKEIVETTKENVKKYMGMQTDLPIESLYTNKFVGNIKFTDDEWKKALDISSKYSPAALAKL